jgi:hypothetical protein
MSTFSEWTLAELKGFRKDLSKILVSAVMEARFGDRMVRYETREDKQAALGMLNREIAAREGGRTRTRQIRAVTSKGFS